MIPSFEFLTNTTNIIHNVNNTPNVLLSPLLFLSDKHVFSLTY